MFFLSTSERQIAGFSDVQLTGKEVVAERWTNWTPRRRCASDETALSGHQFAQPGADALGYQVGLFEMQEMPYAFDQLER